MRESRFYNVFWMPAFAGMTYYRHFVIQDTKVSRRPTCGRQANSLTKYVLLKNLAEFLTGLTLCQFASLMCCNSNICSNSFYAKFLKKYNRSAPPPCRQRGFGNLYRVNLQYDTRANFHFNQLYNIYNIVDYPLV